MATKYHINARGEPGICSAQPGNCPFASEEEHFSSFAEARAAYEVVMAKKSGKTVSKPRVSARVKLDEQGELVFASPQEKLSFVREALAERGYAVELSDKEFTKPLYRGRTVIGSFKKIDEGFSTPMEVHVYLQKRETYKDSYDSVEILSREELAKEAALKWLAAQDQGENNG